ncbi:MAG: DNA repair protein RadC [Lachnospiraceae bacterium]|jgi:DNA repair protein RadC|nr:DNA repair protein RadC [Lachnospiraceae bacterium]
MYTDTLPYEKYLQFGPQVLTDRELLAIILRSGTKEAGVMQIADEVMRLADHNPKGGLLGLYDVTLDQLMSIKGIGMVKAVRIQCLMELTLRFSRAKAKSTLSFLQPHTVAEYYMERLRHEQTECVFLACLDTKLRLLKESLLSKGSARMSLISPREIFIEALWSKASSIMLIHNHPSGDPNPSKSDLTLTEAVLRAGADIGIYLIDHVIIGDNVYTSLKELHYI